MPVLVQTTVPVMHRYGACVAPCMVALATLCPVLTLRLFGLVNWWLPWLQDWKLWQNQPVHCIPTNYEYGRPGRQRKYES